MSKSKHPIAAIRAANKAHPQFGGKTAAAIRETDEALNKAATQEANAIAGMIAAEEQTTQATRPQEQTAEHCSAIMAKYPVEIALASGMIVPTSRIAHLTHEHGIDFAKVVGIDGKHPIGRQTAQVLREMFTELMNDYAERAEACRAWDAAAREAEDDAAAERDNLQAKADRLRELTTIEHIEAAPAPERLTTTEISAINEAIAGTLEDMDDTDALTMISELRESAKFGEWEIVAALAIRIARLAN